ncbi:MAG: DEAD/DEAH box helicase, partial [Bacteroidetes bacterium]|nr:DEAD/DEAH box helicase [Bacteroidota bacterium]
MNIYETHKQIIDSYSEYIRSFINISDPEIQRVVELSLDDGVLWPEPLLQFNPAYEKAGSINDVIETGLLHRDVKHIFQGYELYRHQYDALQLGTQGRDFVVTSGTGSGKSLTYIGTIFNHLLTHPETEGVTAVIVYPMNALINSQTNEFNTYKDNYEKSTKRGFPISYHQYTSQEQEEQRQQMREQPPQILLINYMMLELLLTRVQDRPIRDAIFKHLRYLVFDELHTYRGRQGADVSLLIRRIRSHCQQSICCIGTSATMVSVDDSNSHRKDVARTASTIFGKPFQEEQIVEETLKPSFGDTLNKLPSKAELHATINDGIQMNDPQTKVREHPVIIWLERRIALEIQPDGSIVRRRPMGLN